MSRQNWKELFTGEEEKYIDVIEKYQRENVNDFLEMTVYEAYLAELEAETSEEALDLISYVINDDDFRAFVSLSNQGEEKSKFDSHSETLLSVYGFDFIMALFQSFALEKEDQDGSVKTLKFG